MGAELPTSDAHTMLFSCVTGQFRWPSLRMCGLPSGLVSFPPRVTNDLIEMSCGILGAARRIDKGKISETFRKLLWFGHGGGGS